MRACQGVEVKFDEIGLCLKRSELMDLLVTTDVRAASIHLCICLSPPRAGLSRCALWFPVAPGVHRPHRQPRPARQAHLTWYVR